MKGKKHTEEQIAFAVLRVLTTFARKHPLRVLVPFQATC